MYLLTEMLLLTETEMQDLPTETEMCSLQMQVEMIILLFVVSNK